MREIVFVYFNTTHQAILINWKKKLKRKREREREREKSDLILVKNLKRFKKISLNIYHLFRKKKFFFCYYLTLFFSSSCSSNRLFRNNG